MPSRTSDKRDATRLPYGMIAAGVVLIGVAGGMAIDRMPPDLENQRTVGDAIGTGAYPGKAQAPDAPEKSAGSRLIDLANSLGIPTKDLPPEAVNGDDRTALRELLADVLAKQVANGEFTNAEADAVLKAYDLGIIDVPFLQTETK